MGKSKCSVIYNWAKRDDCTHLIFLLSVLFVWDGCLGKKPTQTYFKMSTDKFAFF